MYAEWLPAVRTERSARGGGVALRNAQIHRTRCDYNLHVYAQQNSAVQARSTPAYVAAAPGGNPDTNSHAPPSLVHPV